MQSKGLQRVFSNTTVQKHQFFGAQLSLQSSSHPYMTTGKTIALTRWTFVDKVISLLFNMLSRLVTTFLPRSKVLPSEEIKGEEINSWRGNANSSLIHCSGILGNCKVIFSCYDCSTAKHKKLRLI